jgi:hypothetical protein
MRVALLFLLCVKACSTVASASISSDARVGIYVLSYKEDDLLRNLLDSITSSALPPNTSVAVINTNRKQLRHRISFNVPSAVRVFDTLQSTFATGHTARHYNEVRLSSLGL